MNFKLPKRYFLKKKLDKQVKNRKLSANTTSLNSVVIVFKKTDEITEELFQTLADSLSILPKDLKIIYYKEDKKSLPTLEENTFSSRDFNWKGELTTPTIIEFLDREYDVLIGYYADKNIYLDMICASVNAPLKVGLTGSNTALFDLIFSVKPKDYNVFEKELIKYLNIIKNKK